MKEIKLTNQQSFWIGEGIHVQFLGIGKLGAKFGFRAPGVRIWREELDPSKLTSAPGGSGMLILSRLPNQKVLMVGGISIEVLDADKNRNHVTLCVSAPTNLEVLRSRSNIT